MKKILTILAVAAMTAVACNKEEAFVPSIAFKGETAVAVPVDGGFYNVEFTANTDWTAELDVDNSVAILNKKSGTKDDNKVKVTIMKSELINAERTITLTITCQDLATPLKVVYTQAGVFQTVFEADAYEFNVGKDGETVSFTVSSNVEYTMEDPGEDWATITKDGDKYSVKVAASRSYDVRTAYFKFSTPEEKVMEDQDWDGTPETEVDLYFYVVVTQDGNFSIEFETDLDVSFKEIEKVSLAMVGSELYVCADGLTSAYNTKTGAWINCISMPETIAIKQITNDDAGNVIILSPGDSLVDVYAVSAANVTDASKYTKIISYDATVDYNYGVGNVKVTGNALSGKAVVTMISAGGLLDEANWIGGDTYVLAFQINDGALAKTFTKTKIETNDIIWFPYSVCAKARTNEIAGGVYYAGYDGYYQLKYNATMQDGAWTAVYECGGDGNDGFNSIDMLEWGGHQFLGYVDMSYFPYWGCNSATVFLNVDNAASPVYGACSYFTGIGATEYEYGVDPQCQTTDILLEIEDGKLATYTIDGMALKLRKMTFPVL